MIISAALLAIVGSADLARPSDVAPTKQQRTRNIFIGLAVTTVVAWGLDLHPGVAVVLLVLALIWWLLTPATKLAPWALVVLAAALVIMFLFLEPALPNASGPFANWFDQARPSVLNHLTFSTLSLGLGGVLFLLNSSNIVVRLVIERTDIEHQIDRTVGEHDDDDDHVDEQEREQRQIEAHTPLKGGRFLGPLERILILSLGIAGQFAGIAAIVGAKSIIRFPEISKSNQQGAAAEYFLIGSGISWGLALLVLAILKLV